MAMSRYYVLEDSDEEFGVDCSFCILNGVVTETKAVKGSEPFGITVDAAGEPWYTMTAANKIAELQLR